MEDQNPEKIALNPVQETVAEKQLYQNPNIEPLSGRDQVMKGMFKRPKQEPTIPLKYKIFLAVIMLIFVIVAAIVGRVLFRNGLI